MPGDVIAIFEAAYARIDSDQCWLQGIADASLPCFDLGLGLTAYTYDASDPAKLNVHACATAGNTTLDRCVIEEVARKVPPMVIERAYGPGPPMFFSQLAAALAREGVPGLDAIQQAQAAHGFADAFAVRGVDHSMQGCIIVVMAPEAGRIAPPRRRVLECVGAHLASAWRLRQSRELAESADAVLDAKGSLVHVRNDETAGQQRQLEQASAKRSLARGSLRTDDPLSAAALWRSMVQGEWTLVDHIDSDGKRFVLARRNRPGVRDLGALTQRENQVASYAAYGFAIKHIGYELGLAESTVSKHLNDAMRKLRVKNRAELVGLLGRPRGTATGVT